jgi:folate/biopterin transporter
MIYDQKYQQTLPMFIRTVTWSELKTTVQEKLLFDQEPTPELWAILTVYFVQGILGLARLAVSFFLKDDLGLSPAQVAALTGIAALPWVVKPIFGFVADGWPLFGYRRRSYMMLSGVLGMLAWLSLATWVSSPWQATLMILLSSTSVAISDVIADSVVVERTRAQSQEATGALQSLTWGVSALGGLITAYLSGSLLSIYSNRVVFGITATFPLLVAAIALLIIEIPTQTPEIKQQVKLLWQGVKQKSVWLPTLFVFLWQATPSADSAFFFFTTNELGFSPEFLGQLRFITNLAVLTGIFIFQRHLKNLPFRVIMGWSTVIAAALGMTTLLLVTHANRYLGIEDHWFSLGDNLILTVVGQITFMPILVISAQICPPGIEATFFALLMSIWNLGGLLSHESGALLTHWIGVTETNFDRLWLLVVITNLTTLLPLPFLGLLPAQSEAGHTPMPSLSVASPEVTSNHPPKTPVYPS